MIRIRNLGLGLVGAGLIAVSSAGIVSATSSNATVGTSGIPKTVFKTERQAAAAEVLHTTTENIQSAHKNKTMAQLIQNAGLTKKTYAEALKTQLATDLQAKGYSQDQITIALQRKTIAHLRHHDKKQSGATSTTTTDDVMPVTN